MAAYAALVSLIHIIDEIEHHPRPPISLDKTQVESLTKKVTFLQDFLEGYSYGGDSKEVDDIASRIANAAYAAEDVIESHIVDQILAGSTSQSDGLYQRIQKLVDRILGGFASDHLYQGLQKVIEDMDFIKKEAMEIKGKMGLQHQLHRISKPAGSFTSPPTGQSTMVGFDDVLREVMDKLTGAQTSRQIIPISGMGGIGKTTLARNIYVKLLNQKHFDTFAWITISQDYNTQEILREVLCQVLNKETKNETCNMKEAEIGDELHKCLFGRRYLIIMDDMWENEVWDKIQFFFPDCNNSSRIVITSRQSNLFTNCWGLEMKLLDEVESLELLRKTVFGNEACPVELEKIGKKIAKGCKGLPLSIVVTGGFLARSELVPIYWQHVAENLNSILNLEDNERCSKILHMSYNELPAHLKSCFLYMGVFKEDMKIRVSILINMWVGEGFLKPISGKSLEETAEMYLKELIDRNLILVHELGSTGNIKYCKIHDRLREICLKEAQKERFYSVLGQDSPNVPLHAIYQRRFVIQSNKLKLKRFGVFHPMWRPRSLICHVVGSIQLDVRLLRMAKLFDENSHDRYSSVPQDMFKLVNLRHLALRGYQDSKFPSSIHLFWNLHTLIVMEFRKPISAPIEIWNMPQLKHVEFRGGLYLPNPPSGSVGREDGIVLGNLRTLMTVENFQITQEVVKRIPNIKKFRISCCKFEEVSNYSLNNLDRLNKLESFDCFFGQLLKSSITDLVRNLTFPHSIKKLNLTGHYMVYWDDWLEKIGSLPFLEKLKLKNGSFKGGKWETIEGHFRSLKFLLLSNCFDLQYWMTKWTHFPRLEHLVLQILTDLKEIPSEIGDIPTLRLIKLDLCSDSVVISAKQILKEQEELENDGLRAQVMLGPQYKALESLASPYFRVQCLD